MAELASKKMTIRYTGVPQTTTQLSATRFPPQNTNPLDIGYVPIPQWSETMGLKP